MPPKQKGGGGAPKKNVAEEVEETLQAVVCFVFLLGYHNGVRVLVD